MEQKVIGDSYFLQTKEEIRKWLNEMEIAHSVINDDLTVNVNGTVNLYKKSLLKLPVSFELINGSFDCSYNRLKSLKGSPKVITGDFSCQSNDLTSLNYCPKIIGGGFYFHYNKVTSLKGCPEIINDSFDCFDNQLKTLEYFPITKKHVNIERNPLKTLRGLKNISAHLLFELLGYFPKLNWKEIEWKEVKNIDEITVELYENIENKENIPENEEILKRIQELQLY